jgi:exopolyphosphatase/guanosine-5'-triphosphate,3'-diphosphate pyrophosphatase
MKKRHKFFLIKIITILILSVSFFAHHYFYREFCLEDRYAFDFGSGAIKAKAVSFDTCSNKIHKVFAQYDKPVKFANCMVKKESGHGFEINRQCIQQAMIEFNNFEDELHISCQKDKCAGVATAWARKADNVDIIIDSLRAIGVKIKVLSQEEEGLYGFYSVVKSRTTSDTDVQDIIVWDIGGGSFQLATLDENNKLHVYHGPHGVESFERELRLVKNLPHTDKSPFFVSTELDDALNYAYEKYGKPVTLDPVIYKKLATNKNIKVYGIGGPMTKGFKKQMYIPATMKQDDLVRTAKIFEHKTPEEIKNRYFPEVPGHYTASAQISCILVHGVMKGAGIKTVEILDNTLSEYVLYDKTLW